MYSYFPFLGDFGVVSISPAADSSVEEAGVVLFWSPELVQQKVVNHKVDIWALGIVILEVLNGGKAPYEDDKLDEDEVNILLFDHNTQLTIVYRLNREFWMLVNLIIHQIYLRVLLICWITVLILILVQDPRQALSCR